VTRLLNGLAHPPARAPRPHGRAKRPAVASDDELREISPAVYVQVLTGLTPGRDGKVSCPFHGEDRTPSLHVYSDPADGWYCFGCQRGGSIYDLGAEVFGLSTRGRDFVMLSRRLHEALGAWAPIQPPASAQSETRAGRADPTAGWHAARASGGASAHPPGVGPGSSEVPHGA
jgi:hypothetical protein